MRHSPLILALLLMRPSMATVQLPIEVAGHDGNTKAVNLSLSSDTVSRATGLFLHLNNYGYDDKGSVRINAKPWITLNNTTTTVYPREQAYGGIGGPLRTLRLTVPLPPGTLLNGTNVLRFRFNRSDGVSTGYRVLAFNLTDNSGARLLLPSLFRQDDPTLWKPPYTDPTQFAAGRALWYSASIKSSWLSGAVSIRAHCADCHAQDGRDLKYFNFSNDSIIVRSMFHGLSTTQGKQIASYIRSLNAPSPGRPWNPPFQPGPGLDNEPLANWSAGAGLSWVLDNDADAFAWLFPGGIKRETVSIGNTLNMRELPILLQLPDWNDWLPTIHPKDAWGDEWVNSRMNKLYAGEGTATADRNFRTQFNKADYSSYLWNGSYSPFRNDIGSWVTSRLDFLVPKVTIPQASWTLPLFEKVYSTGRWQMVKQWELMQEFHLEDKGPILWPGTGEPRTWPGSAVYRTAPHQFHAPDSLWTDKRDLIRSKYLSNAWYHLGVILNSGQKKRNEQEPVDWGYNWAHIDNLLRLGGPPEPARLTAQFIKVMQEMNNGIGPERSQYGWYPYVYADPVIFAAGSLDANWKNVSRETRVQIINALLAEWLDKTASYSPSQYYASYNGRTATADEVPTEYYAWGRWVNRVSYMIQRFRSWGVDDALLNRTCDWAATVWPKGNFQSLKG